jgi:hypothetical protein
VLHSWITLVTYLSAIASAVPAQAGTVDAGTAAAPPPGSAEP